MVLQPTHGALLKTGITGEGDRGVVGEVAKATPKEVNLPRGFGPSLLQHGADSSKRRPHRVIATEMMANMEHAP